VNRQSKPRHTPYAIWLCLSIAIIATLVTGFFTLRQSDVTTPVVPSQPAPTETIHPTRLTIPETFTLRDKIGQLLVIGANSRGMAVSLEKQYQIGGFLLRPRSGLYSKEATTAISHAGQLPPLLIVDQEGGRVSRLSSAVFSHDSAKYMGTLPDGEVEKIGYKMGLAIKDVGANLDYAPVVDLDDGKNAVISTIDRSFSSDPDVVTKKARAFAHGLRRAGIVPTFKHFPGLGRATGATGGNTDTGTATSPLFSSLKAHDLLPYHQLLRPGDISTVMVGNQIVPELTNGQPASLNAATYRYLRDTYGFDQVVFTDELLLAKAVARVYPHPAEAVIAAIKAGADMPLVDPADEKTVGSIIDSIAASVNRGEISEYQIDASLARIMTLKSAIANATVAQ